MIRVAEATLPVYIFQPSELFGSLGFFMRWILVILFFALAGCGRTETSPAVIRAHASTQPLAHLVVHVVDLNTHNGQLLFCMFKSAEGFPGNAALAVNSQVEKVSGDNQFTVDLAPGKYAAAVVHDENSNGKLDTNFLGIPKEGYGVSNNPKPRRRGVNYLESEFTLPEGGASISISMQYDFF